MTFSYHSSLSDSSESAVTKRDDESQQENTNNYVNMGEDSKQQSINESTKHAVESYSILSSKKQIDLCYGPRPWYFFFFSPRFWRKVYKCSQYDSEMEKILRLAFPYTVQTLLRTVFGLLEAAVISKILGTSSLAAYYSTDLGIGLATMYLTGVLRSLKVLVSHSIGARNFKLVGIYVQLSVWTHQLLFLPIIIIGWNRFGILFLWLGFDEETARTAQEYAKYALLYEGFGVYDDALHYVLKVSGHERYSTILNTFHSFLSFIIVFGVSNFYNGTQLWMIGAIHLALMILFFIVNVGIIRYNKWFIKYWRGMIGTNPFREWRPIATFIRAAIPLSFSYVVDHCEWNVLFIFAALQGPAEVAVWGLVGQIWEIADDLILAISDASEVRVAHLLGLGRPRRAKESADKSMFLGVVSGGLLSALLGLLHTHIPKWVTNDGIIQRMLINLMPIVCLGIALLSYGSMSWSILCAQGRTPLATAVTCFGSLFITLPMASLSTFYFNYNLKALAACLILGYCTSGFFNSLLMLTSDWEKISKIVKERTKYIEETMKNNAVANMTEKDGVLVDPEGEQYVDYTSFDFDELPEDGKRDKKSEYFCLK